MDQDEVVDSIGELVAMCERDGFIPRYYVDSPKDKIDRIIQDMQKYTHDLVTEELGLENLIKTSVTALEREQETIKAAAETGESFEEQQEEALFNYSKIELEDQDFIDFQNQVDIDELFEDEDEDSEEEE